MCFIISLLVADITDVLQQCFEFNFIITYYHFQWSLIEHIHLLFLNILQQSIQNKGFSFRQALERSQKDIVSRNRYGNILKH